MKKLSLGKYKLGSIFLSIIILSVSLLNPVLSYGVEEGEEGEILLEDLKERARLKEGRLTGAAKGKNLIVIQIESLQNFVIGLEKDGQEITPNINKLIGEQGTIYFNNYYQMIGRGKTSDAEFITNNSLYPSMDGSSYLTYEENYFYGLPWLLRDQGYNAWSFHGYEADFWNRRLAHKNQGFEKFFGKDDFEYSEEDVIGWGIKDSMFFDQTLEHIKENRQEGKPFYSFIISLTNHNPFTMPAEDEYLELDQETRDNIYGDYLQAVRYTDEEIGRFIENLKEEGLYEDSLIVMYGDHFGLFPVGSQKELITRDINKEYSYDEMMKIPLIVHIPEEEINETITRTGGQIDFLPTITNIMGLDNKKGIAFGRDLLNYEEDNLIGIQSSLLRGSFIDEDVIFGIDREGVFENSEAYRLKDLKKLDHMGYKDKSDRVVREIRASEYILKNNLIKDIVEGKEVKIGNYHQPVDIAPTVKNTDSSFEDMDRAVKKGYKTLGVSIGFDEAKNETYLGDGIPGEELMKWMAENPEISLVVDIEDRELLIQPLIDGLSINLFHRLPDETQDFMDRFHPYAKTLDEFQTIQGLKYSPVLDLSDGSIEYEVFKDFMNRFSVDTVSLDRTSFNNDLAKKLRSDGLTLYCKNVDSWIAKFILRFKGVKGIVTNKL